MHYVTACNAILLFIGLRLYYP